MAFSSLSQATQDIFMIRFEFFGKIFLIGFFLVIALYYILYLRKTQKDTPYILVALLRTWLYALSLIYLFFTPLFIVFLYPQKPLDSILGATFLFYRYAILIIGILIFINLLFFAPLIIAKIGGLEIKSKNTSIILEKWFGKYKEIFNKR